MKNTNVSPFKVGDKVRINARHLRNTRNHGGGNSVWVVLSVANPDFVTVDEEIDPDLVARYFTPDELEKNPFLKFRTFHKSNLIKVGTPDYT